MGAVGARLDIVDDTHAFVLGAARRIDERTGREHQRTHTCGSRRRHFDRPRRVTRKGVDRFVSDAIEFEVRISEAFPIRALGPALWVGNVALTSADAEGLTYHFFAFEEDKLQPGAPISVGWSSPSERRKKTRYRFVIPRK